jgi:hypothetical protein
MRAFCIVFLLCIIRFSGNAQNPSDITRLEYGINAFPSIGGGTKVAVTTPATNMNLSTHIPLTGLSEGTHLLYVRVQNRSGVWSPTYQMPFIVVTNATPAITKIEYSFDSFKVPGTGTVLNWPNGNKMIIPLNGLDPGVHILYVRVQNEQGVWSAVNEQIVYVAGGTSKVKEFRYYFEGTNFTSSVYTHLLPSPSSDITATIHTNDGILEKGNLYTMYVTPIDNEGKVGQTQSISFTYGGIASSVSNASALGITFFPNPATTQISVVYSGETLNFKLFNMNGSIVKSGSVEGGIVNVSDLPKGKYLILFENKTISAISDVLIK